MELKTLSNYYLQDYNLLHPGTMQGFALHSSFFTADGVGYFPRTEGGFDLVLSDEPNNLVLWHLSDSISQIKEQERQLTFFDYFYPKKKKLEEKGIFKALGYPYGGVKSFLPCVDEATEVKKSAFVVDMGALRFCDSDSSSLYGDSEKYCYINVRLEDGFINVGRNKFKKANTVEALLLQRLGCSPDNLQWLKEKHVEGYTLTIALMKPEFVLSVLATEKGYNSLWMPSSLSDTRCLPGINLADGNMAHSSYFRGVPKDRLGVRAF